MSGRFVMIFASAGIFILYLISAITQPATIGLNELGRYEGNEIAAKGIVVEKYYTKSENTVIKLRADNTTVPVFIKGCSDIEVGDEIKVIGKVQSYNGEMEIIVSDCTKIDVLKKWFSESISLLQLKSQPEKYKDANINVTGYACSISSSEFCLLDNISAPECQIGVYLRKNSILPTEKAKVFVKALFRYDERTFCYFLDLESSSHGVGVID